jgi:hypothetical protein
MEAEPMDLIAQREARRTEANRKAAEVRDALVAELTSLGHEIETFGHKDLSFTIDGWSMRAEVYLVCSGMGMDYGPTGKIGISYENGDGRAVHHREGKAGLDIPSIAGKISAAHATQVGRAAQADALRAAEREAAKSAERLAKTYSLSNWPVKVSVYGEVWDGEPRYRLTFTSLTESQVKAILNGADF